MMGSDRPTPRSHSLSPAASRAPTSASHALTSAPHTATSETTARAGCRLKPPAARLSHRPRLKLTIQPGRGGGGPPRGAALLLPASGIRSPVHFTSRSGVEVPGPEVGRARTRGRRNHGRPVCRSNHRRPVGGSNHRRPVGRSNHRRPCRRSNPSRPVRWSNCRRSRRWSNPGSRGRRARGRRRSPRDNTAAPTQSRFVATRPPAGFPAALECWTVVGIHAPHRCPLTDSRHARVRVVRHADAVPAESTGPCLRPERRAVRDA
jgi:hypothetical protein